MQKTNILYIVDNVTISPCERFSQATTHVPLELPFKRKKGQRSAALFGVGMGVISGLVKLKQKLEIKKLARSTVWQDGKLQFLKIPSVIITGL